MTDDTLKTVKLVEEYMLASDNAVLFFTMAKHRTGLFEKLEADKSWLWYF